MERIEIPLKLPSLNDYVNANRKHRMAGAKMKKQVDEDIAWFLNPLPRFEKPVKIHFIWYEGNKRRDYDNVCSSKKFILDALVKSGKLKDDNRKYVVGYMDDFVDSDHWKVVLEIEEVEE